MNQNLNVFILKLYKNKQKCLLSSRKFSMNYSALNILGIFWKMGKFENFTTRVTKKFLSKVRKEKCLIHLL